MSLTASHSDCQCRGPSSHIKEALLPTSQRHLSSLSDSNLRKAGRPLAPFAWIQMIHMQDTFRFQTGTEELHVCRCDMGRIPAHAAGYVRNANDQKQEEGE